MGREICHESELYGIASAIRMTRQAEKLPGLGMAVSGLRITGTNSGTGEAQP
jgi:hypothetical protein